MEEKQILLNSIRTPDGTILISHHRHDFVCHKDKNGKQYCVDGGNDYLKRNFDTPDYKELSVYDNGKHALRRKTLMWGVNYDEYMNRLPQTEYRLIKDLDTQHIEAILETQKGISIFLKTVFKKELLFRENKTM